MAEYPPIRLSRNSILTRLKSTMNTSTISCPAHIHRENASSASSPSPLNATLPLPLNTSHTVSGLSTYPDFLHLAFSQSAKASAEQLNRLVSHSCKIRSTIGRSGRSSSFGDCSGTEESGRGRARGGNVASYAVRK